MISLKVITKLGVKEMRYLTYQGCSHFGFAPHQGHHETTASPLRAWSIMSQSYLPTSPPNLKGWHACRVRGQKRKWPPMTMTKNAGKPTKGTDKNVNKPTKVLHSKLLHFDFTFLHYLLHRIDHIIGVLSTFLGAVTAGSCPFFTVPSTGFPNFFGWQERWPVEILT